MAGARVLEVDTAADPVSCQKAIDDNPESSISITSSENTPGMVLEYASPVSIKRVSLLTNGNAKGRFDFYLLATLDSKRPVAWNSQSEYLQVANSIPDGSLSPAEIDLTGMDPTATVILDGTSSRSSIDFRSTITGFLLVQWTPADGTSSAELSELNSFSSSSLNTYEVKSDIPAVGELSEIKGDQSKDGKTFADFKGGKEILPPAVGERLPSKIPFVPGALGAPVILNNLEMPTSH